MEVHNKYINYLHIFPLDKNMCFDKNNNKIYVLGILYIEKWKESKLDDVIMMMACMKVRI